MTMPSYNRRQQNSNSDNLVFLTPHGTDTGKNRSQYRPQINSYPGFNRQRYLSSNSNFIKPVQTSSNFGSSSARKRRGNENSVKNTKEVVPAIDDGPDSKKRKSLVPEAVPQPIVLSYFELLAKDILQYSERCQQTDDLLQKKLRLRSTLLAIFRREFPAASLHLVGSSCNGFASQSSDADFCLMLTQWRAVDQRIEAVIYLRRLQKLLKHCPYIKDLQVIRAKVPILKFRDSVSCCQCDVNINNSVGIRNTHLLRTYSRVDQRVRPLIVVVKMWASSRGINDASKGTLSSYSLVLMVIHYLQAGSKAPVIPSLQQQYPDYFRHDLSLDHLPMFDPADVIPCNRSLNMQSVAELLEGFLEYYANNFRWDFLAISVRLGRATPKSLSPGAREKPIFIEEPFDLTNTARSVYDWNMFSKIKSEFKRAHELIQRKVSLEGLFHLEKETS